MHPLLSRLEPLAFRVAQLVLVAGLAYGAWSLARPYVQALRGNPFGARVVVLDVVKLANAQRAVASQFLSQSSANVDAATSLKSMQRGTRAAVQRVAGAGTLVLVKQAVVSDGLPDITDAVLNDLGLPTNVPTQNPTAYTLDEAPTNLSLMPMPARQAAKPASTAVDKLIP